MTTWSPREGLPDFLEQLEPARQVLQRLGPKRVVAGVVAVIAGLWLASGLYIVNPGERGVVLLFGRIVGQTEPGLRYRLPAPIESHTVVDVQLFVQYLVHDPVKFLFRARDPERALQSSAEIALRAAVGQNTIDYTMTDGRVEVQDRVKKQLQALLDLYGTGLLATEVRLLVVDPPKEVKEAFHDVVRAWEDRERFIKEADGYRESVIPKARGEAVQMLRAAEAYREQRLIRAQGDADRFLRIQDEYRKAEAVTRDRLYLEMIDRVLPKTHKVVLDAGKGGVVPLLPLKDFFSDRPAPPSRPGAPGTADPTPPAGRR